MTDEKELIAIIVEKIQKENNGNNDWKKVSIKLAKKGIVKTPNGCRKAYGRYLKKNPKPKIEVDEYKEDLYVGSIEYRNDGTQISERKIMMSEKDMKNPSYVLEAHGFDSNEFELVSARNNFWTGHSNEQGEVINYQSKITVKPKVESKELTKDDISSIVTNIKPIEWNYELKQVNTNGEEKVAIELTIPDLHMGSFSWNEEVGKDYDIKIAFGEIYKFVTDAKKIIDMFNVDKIILAFLGDFVHIDTIDSTTSKGTRLDSDSRPKKIAKKSLEAVMYIIENLAISDTELIWVEGNHSRLVEYTVFMALPYIYQHAKHIKFHVEPISRKVFMYKGNLIGFTHGDMKKENMFNWIQIEFKKEWGQSNYVEIHNGHLHQEYAKEKGGIIQRTNPTRKRTDLYEYENGWYSNKAFVAYVWSETDNLKAQFYLR